MNKQKTTINIDKDLLKFIKIKAVDLDITITDLITLYFKYGLINHKKINKRATNMQYNKYKLKNNFKNP